MSAKQNKSASIPTTEHPSSTAAQIKSLVRDILLASPLFPKLYADVVLSTAPNSNEAKLLAANYKKIIDNVSVNRTNMSISSHTKLCTHIRVTGVRCGSPALRGEPFCYFHQRMISTVKAPASRLHPAALLQNEEAIQASIMEVVNALIRGTIDNRRGELILRALNAAIRNARRVRFADNSDMITQVPDYPNPNPPDQDLGIQDFGSAYMAALARIKAPSPVPPSAPETLPRVEPKGPSLGNIHVGTAAPGSLPRAEPRGPGGPELPGRSAPEVAAKANSIDPTKRKPPLGVKELKAPKERRIAAHRVSGG